MNQKDVREQRIAGRTNRLLDGLVRIGQNEANVSSGRNLPIRGLEIKKANKISKIERAGESLYFSIHPSQVNPGIEGRVSERLHIHAQTKLLSE